jgi:hypothetical protein
MPFGRQITIISIVGGASAGTATDIDQGYPIIVAIVGSSGGSQTYCRLPAAAEIGDIVEIYTDGSSNTSVLAPAGEAFINTSTNPLVGIDEGGIICRKVSATGWVWIH